LQHPGAAANDIVGAWSLAGLGGLANNDRWNVADGHDDAVEQVQQLLRDHALALFARFDAVDDVVAAARALRSPFPALPHRWPVDVLLCFGDARDAQAMVDAWWALTPAPADNLRALLERLQTTPPADITDHDLSRAEFVGAGQWKLARRHGVQVTRTSRI
jgi:hypothetical protein